MVESRAGWRDPGYPVVESGICAPVCAPETREIGCQVAPDQYVRTRMDEANQLDIRAMKKRFFVGIGTNS